MKDLINKEVNVMNIKKTHTFCHVITWKENNILFECEINTYENSIMLKIDNKELQVNDKLVKDALINAIGLKKFEQYQKDNYKRYNEEGEDQFECLFGYMNFLIPEELLNDDILKNIAKFISKFIIN